MQAEALTSAFAVAQEFNSGGGEKGGGEQEGEGTYLSIREITRNLGKQPLLSTESNIYHSIIIGGWGV